MSRRLWWVVLLPSACTRINAGFDLGDDDDSGSAEGSGTAPTGKTSEDGSATAPDDDSSGSISVSSSSSGSDADTGVVTTGATSETGGTCSAPEGVEVSIAIEPPPANADPNCATVWTSPQGPITVAEDTISVVPCMCECADEPIPSHTVTVPGVELPELPACGYLAAWQISRDGVCVWGGFAVFGEGSQPSWIVSRSLVVPVAIFGGLTVERHPIESCPAENCEAAGAYELEFVGAGGDSVITMDEAPKTMMLPFFAALPYVVDNVSSVVGEDCRDRTAWTADYDG